jgi:hypothetical protein
MSYHIIEDTPEGFINHTVDNAEKALSLWYALDGEVLKIKNKFNQDLKLEDLIAEVAAEKSSQRNLPTGWQSSVNK